MAGAISAARGLILGAPTTGSGKTIVTLALSILLQRRGLTVSTAKIGPDYIDSAFHALATGRPCRNLDGWAMRATTIEANLGDSARGAEILLIEGVMGLFDGAPDGGRIPAGSTAEMALMTGLPVVIVMSAKGQGGTAAAILSGLAGFDPSVRVAGVIFNHVRSDRHGAILAQAAEHADLPALGFLPQDEGLALPSRHLGLVQASEYGDLKERLEGFADRLGPHLDLDGMLAIAGPIRAEAANSPSPTIPPPVPPPVPPLGQRIALARDEAFTFAYDSMIESWRREGSEILPFSPLADEAPDSNADAIFLPGGYPELHAGRLAGNRAFLTGLAQAASRGAVIYGECGGYMVLGQGLIGADGQHYAMAGLLPIVTSFERPKLHLGYRRGEIAQDTPLGRKGTQYRGHEFHYASVISEDGEAGLFRVADSLCRDLGSQGRRQGSVMGSFLHLIDRA